MPQDFPQFANLPLELRRVIWEYAAAGWTQVIPLSLSNPKEAWEDPPFDSRKHLFASEMAAPPLLYACHDSRAAALEFYTRGLDFEVKNAWSWRATLFNDVRYRECPYDKELQDVGEMTYWAPDNDVVMLEHAEEPYLCDGTSICNSMPFRRHEYKFDERIKYMAIRMEVWNGGTGSILLEVPGLQIVYVLVDRKPCFPFLESTGTEDMDTIEAQREESCRILEGQMAEAISSNSALFRLKRGMVAGISVQVVLVESIDELIEQVGKRREVLKLRSFAIVSND
ncbi:uncharacterized protein PAC_11160 [Phialocephala subalpina]|uniref:2EXR domain-containing protein n=1 Tax=Phialocephala subalpina TaxID=576137 RepID=A0A1L7X8B5_9HELO|nr:uncharacterized protein PAC_11160 [Phialocephala subalpina]